MRRTDILPFLALTLAACSGATKKTEPPVDNVADESSVEIHFVRGHNAHRLLASHKGDAVTARSFLDRQVLAESTVDRTRYLGFLKQASEFLKGPRGTAPEPCRTPFTVTVRIGAETRAASGCAGADEGALSHLVRDGEFLLHQGSGMRVK